MHACVCVYVCVYVCVCVCLSVCVSRQECEAELIWRLLIATIETPIHISQSKFSFHKKFEMHHIIHIFVSFDVEHNIES